MLSKKYEEKYKQVAEIASKLTIEEATFRDIQVIVCLFVFLVHSLISDIITTLLQERKVELHQAIVKMEQGGSADGILQVLIC